MAFGIDKKRVSHNEEVFTFSVRSTGTDDAISNNSITDLNFFNGTMMPCLHSQAIHHNICNSRDTEFGNYYGSYTPVKTGPVLLSIFYNSPTSGDFFSFSPMLEKAKFFSFFCRVICSFSF